MVNSMFSDPRRWAPTGGIVQQDKVLVIGGAGFLGSHLADHLADAGYQVVLFDLHPSPWQRKNQDMFVGDVRDEQAVAEAVKGARYVFHMAGIADIEAASVRPKETVIQNVIGSTNVIEACIQEKVEKLLFASTVYVYSDKGSFYRVSKQSAELLLENYHREFGIKYTTLRYGSLYGPRSQEWNGLKKFVTQAIRDGRIVYPGTGHERREYIHVKDAAKLSVQAMMPEFDNQCLTLTGTQVMTTRDVLTMIAEIMNQKVELVFEPSGSTYNRFHYQMTPYRYTPKSGQKLVSDHFIDLGQGILDMIDEAHQNYHESCNGP